MRINHADDGVNNATGTRAFRLSMIGTAVPFRGEVHPLVLALAMVH